MWQLFAASISAVQSSLALTSAPAAISSFVISVLQLAAALTSAVLPELLLTLTSAPAAISSFVISVLPLSAASISAVLPLSLLPLISITEVIHDFIVFSSGLGFLISLIKLCNVL